MGKRGVPKTTKPAPPVVAIKMDDLLAASDNQEESVADDSTGLKDAQKTNQNEGEQQQLHQHQKEMKKQMQDEGLKLEKEHQETLKREEEAKSKKEQERLAKLWQEQKQREKIKKVEETKAKKLNERQEKHQKQQQKIEKQKKEEQAKNKRAIEEQTKQSRQDEGKIEVAGVKTQKSDLPDEEATLIQEAEKQHLHGSDMILNIDPDTKSELKPTESVIKRGVPKITKPAPAVVAIKMVELLAA